MSGMMIGPLERFGVGIVGTDVAQDLSFEIVSYNLKMPLAIRSRSIFENQISIWSSHDE